MSYRVILRDNETGEVRERTMYLDWSDSSHYWWTDGNFGCDCNRFLEFERAAGRSPGLDDAQCGDGRYSAIKAILADGSEIPLDDVGTTAPEAA